MFTEFELNPSSPSSLVAYVETIAGSDPRLTWQLEHILLMLII